MATPSSKTNKRAIRLGVWLLVVVLCWTIAIAILAGVNIRGGISVVSPWAPSQETVDARIPVLLLVYGEVWAVGILSRLQRQLSSQKRAESGLRESEERHRALFHQSQDAMMTMAAPSWQFTAGNPAALTLFGVKTRDEFLTLGPWDVSREWQPDGCPSAENAQKLIATAMCEG